MLTANRLTSFTAKSAIIIATLCMLGVLLSGPGYRFELWPLRLAFDILKWSVYLCAVSTILAIINISINKLNHLNLFNIANSLALAISLLSAGIPYLYFHEFQKIDTIADITTDLQDPPVFVELIPIRKKTSLNPLEYRDGDARVAQLNFFPNLNSLKSTASIEQVIKEAERITAEAGLKLVSANPEEGRLEATQTSFWYGFKDDVIVRAKKSESGETLIDIRSASRVGYSDGGVNGKRVQMYLDKLNKRLN